MSTNNFSTTGGRPVSATEETMVFMTKFKVEAILRKEKEKALVSAICLDLKPSCFAEITTKLYPVRDVTPQFQKLMVGEKYTGACYCCIDSSVAHADEPDLCLREFSKSMMDQACTWFVNLKPWYAWLEQLACLFNIKLFCAEPKLTLVELGRTYQYPGMIWMLMLSDSIRAANYYDLVTDILVDLCLQRMNEDYQIYLKNLHFFPYWS